MHRTNESITVFKAISLALGILAALLAFRIAGPSDIDDNDQPGPLSHILDVAVNDQWLFQHDPAGRAVTKPPMYPWLGAIAVKLTGSTDEWALKLPLMVATLVITLIVFDLARRKAGPWAALIAAAVWVANVHVLKLGYTARTDMLVSMWVAVALWCVELQCEGWRKRRATDNEGASSRWLIALFWVCIAAGALTKGPVVLLPILWLAGRIAIGQRWKASRVGWQVAGLMLCLGLVAAWIVPTIVLHPEYLATVRAEVVDRTTGQGTGGHRSTPMVAVPLYFVRGFAPWSIAAMAVVLVSIVAFIRALAWRRKRPIASLRLWHTVRQIGWPAWWMVLVLVFFAIPQGRRADYLVPAYVGGAVAVGWLVTLAQARQGGWRVLVHLLLGGLAMAGVSLGAAWPWLRMQVAQPVVLRTLDLRVSVGEHYGGLLMIACGVALVGGVYGLWLTHRRHYQPAAFAVAVAMVGILSIFNLTFSRAARHPGGDEVIAITRLADAAAGRLQAPIHFYRTGNVPVQALLGRHEPMDATALDRASVGAVVVTSDVGLIDIRKRFLFRAEHLSQTDELEESGRQVHVVYIRPVE